MICINVYDEGLERIGVLETWISLVWDEEYGDEGRFQLEVWHTDEAARLLKEDVFCGIAESETLAVIKSVVYRDKKIVFSGAMAVGVLQNRTSMRRVFEENAENAMREIVGGMTAYPPVALGAAAGIADMFMPEIRDMEVIEYLRQISAETDVGFRLRHDRENRRLAFECYKPGVNENARFATAYGNLGDIHYSRSNAEYKNVAVIINEYSETKDGETKEYRKVLYAGKTDAVGKARREMIIKTSARPEEEETEAEFEARLIGEGEAELIEAAEIENIEFEVDDDRVKLGDVIRVLLPELNVNLTVRVIGVHITHQKNKSNRTISVGTPILKTKRR